MSIETAAPPELDAIIDEKGQKPDTFTVWKPSQFLQWEPPQDADIISNDEGEPILYNGSIAGLVGAPGVGKSRVALDIAIHQITGREWCGLRLSKTPRKWLFLGNENSLRRWKADLSAMYSLLNESQKTLIETNLLIHAQTGTVADIDMTLSQRWTNTIQITKPDILVVDPFESTVGDGNNAGEVREAITGMKAILTSVNPDGTLLLIHHARTGRAATLGAVGFDGNNFAKGSKTFTSICRLQINIAASDEDGSGVVVAIGKSNDAQPFKPFAALLDAKSMTYRRDNTFSLDDWKTDVEGKRTGKSCTIRHVLECFKGKGSLQRKEILEMMDAATGASQRTRNQRITDAHKSDFITPSETRGEWMLSEKGKEQIK